MKNCIIFPVRQTANLVFYTSNIVLFPLIFGVGLVGNFLLIVVLNHGTLRKQSSVYVYLTGVAAADMLRLLVLAPDGIRDMEILPPNVTYSKVMVYVTTWTYCLSSLFQHASSWLLPGALFLRYATVRWPWSKPRWARISASRMAVLITFIIAIMINFPRLFEVEVLEVRGHCFSGMSLWHWNYTVFGQDSGFQLIYPWSVTALGHALPIILVIIVLNILVRREKFGRLCKAKKALKTPDDDDGNERQNSAVLVFAGVLFLCLELPTLIAHILLSLYGHEFRKTFGFYEFTLIANSLSLIRSSINFILYSVYCSDFRKGLRRTCCCLCNTDDEYYEPIRCCCGGRPSEFSSETTTDNSSLDERVKNVKQSNGWL